jgi:hypothetical protein
MPMFGQMFFSPGSYRTCVLSLLTWSSLLRRGQGLLLVFILGGGVQSNVFEQEESLTRTKAYLTFILCFVALTNLIRFFGSTMYLAIRLFTG